MDPEEPGGAAPDHETAGLARVGSIWNVSWRGESGSLAHVKGLTDIATLVQHRGQEVSALQLMGGLKAAGGREPLIDLEALGAYRRRLDDLGTEIDQAGQDADLGTLEHLEVERDQVLLELRRVTGLGGRLRRDASDPAERARKAVSARIRDAIRRLEAVTPLLAGHLDRSIRTGLHCSYTPEGDRAVIRWRVGG